MKNVIYVVIMLVGILMGWTLRHRAHVASMPKKETFIVFSDHEVPSHKVREINGATEVFLDSQDQSGQVDVINK